MLFKSPGQKGLTSWSRGGGKISLVMEDMRHEKARIADWPLTLKGGFSGVRKGQRKSRSRAEGLD